MNEPDKKTQYALLTINKLRVGFGLKPLDKMPSGRLGEPCDCPAARALAPCGVVHVQPSSVQFSSPAVADKANHLWGDPERFGGYPSLVAMPDDLAQWVDRFDEGEYPELVEHVDEGVIYRKVGRT